MNQLTWTSAYDRDKFLQLPDMHEHPDTQKLVHREVDGTKKYLPLDLQATPLTVTFGIFADKLIFDPCQQEADQMVSLIQVTVAGGGHCSGMLPVYLLFWHNSVWETCPAHSG